jgi:tetratricopeptide (TPR) repeat protein
MSHDVICPSCGFRNPPGLDSCASCNYPFVTPETGATPPPGAPPPSETPGVAGAPSYEPPQRPLRRPQRRAAPMQAQSLWLWLLFGTFAAAILIWTAIDANRKRTVASTVEGSSDEQQKMANTARAAIATDSTNLEAQVALGNVLYDTGHWDEAIVHYRAVLRHDPTRVPVMVDLGVCYYNLGDAKQAEELFMKALSLDPHQSIALFNMGIVSERRGDLPEAMKYYHGALESAPSEELKTAIAAALQRTAQLSGKQPPPLGKASGQGADAGGK